MGKFSDKIALITGGSDGIGLSIAKRLGSEGATIIISSRNQKKINNALDQLKKLNITCYGKVSHAGKLTDIKDLIDFCIKTCSKIDILIPNAATNPHFGPFLTAEKSHFDKTYQVNLLGPFLLCKYAAPYMPKGSSIILNASIGAYQLPSVQGIYSILKTALLGMNKILSDSLAPKGIRVNAVAPGLIPTKFSSALVNNKMAVNYTLGQTPLKRLGKPEEIASVVAFLASKDASYITGETISVAGGARSRL